MGGLRHSSILSGNMGFLDNLGKFREVGLEPLLELVGRAADGLAAGDPQTLEHVGCGQRRLGALLDDADDLARRVGRHEPALPARRFEAGEPALRDRRHVGQRRERLAPATASARTVPAVTCGSDVAIGVTATWISPVMRAGKIAASPRYGTGWMSTPAMVLNISMVRWSGLPTPVMP